MAEEEISYGLDNPDSVTKYKLAGEIAGKVVKAVAELCKAGTKTIDICKAGDDLILKETGTVFKGKKVEKGIAFPTCISVNHCICHNSPLVSDDEIVLADGDVVKIDLGVHLDGFIGTIATTTVVGASAEKPVTGRKADAIMAAHIAGELAIRMVKDGAKNGDITAAISKVAEAFNCKPIEGMLSHQIERNKIDGEKVIIQNPNETHSKSAKPCTFESGEVYAIDIIMSTGEGKSREGEQRTTVFKKSDTKYQLKMQASRQFFSELSKKFTVMPFTLRSFEDEKKARMGVVECVKHKVVDPFSILWEREGAYVAQFKQVVLLMPSGNQRATIPPFEPTTVQSEFKFEDEELSKVLATSLGSKKKKNKKKSKAKKEDAGAAAEAE